jgi:hypothetical protein
MLLIFLYLEIIGMMLVYYADLARRPQGEKRTCRRPKRILRGSAGLFA